MDLSALADFNLVATHGSFGKASRITGRSKTTLSRRVMALEESLGLRLLERNTRALRLTNEGQSLFLRTDSLLNEIKEIRHSLTSSHSVSSGALRVSVPVLISHLALGRIAASFSKTYPDLRLEINAEDRCVNLIEEGYDMVIRCNPSPRDDLVGRCILRDPLIVVAPANFVCPNTTDTELRHPRFPAVVLTSAPENETWEIRVGPSVRVLHPVPVLRFSSLVMIKDAVREGAGVALLPLTIVKQALESGELVSWGTHPYRMVELWALHTSRRLANRKVTGFIQFLHSQFQENSLDMYL